MEVVGLELRCWLLSLRGCLLSAVHPHLGNHPLTCRGTQKLHGHLEDEELKNEDIIFLRHSTMMPLAAPFILEDGGKYFRS